MNSGKHFEKDWAKSINKGKIYYMRLKDSPASFGQDSKFVRFTANNPYDNFCFYKRTLFPFELKHTKNKFFSIQREKKEKNKMIKLNQIEGLTYASKYEGVEAGFVFNIKDEEKNTNHTYWLDIKDFNRFLEESDKKSINENDIINYGALYIDSTLKKVSYTYEVEELFAEIMYGRKENKWDAKQKE